MASHRKPRPGGTIGAGLRTPALATAALTSMAVLSQTAEAAPGTDHTKPSMEEVEKKVDDLYRQAESATEKYDAAKERAGKQRGRVDALRNEVARRTDRLNKAREELGSFAAAQYRSGVAAPPTATFLLADNPQDYFDESQLMNRLTSREKSAVDAYIGEQAATMKERRDAAESLQTLTSSQHDLQTAKSTVQKKLASARELLSQLTAQEKARLAEIERKQQEEAARKAAELAKQQAEQQQAAGSSSSSSTGSGSGSASGSGSGSGSSTGSGSGGSSTSGSYDTKAEKAIAFARSQIGKPYVWGATGPDSYDCSGLSQAAWRAAGVTLPRTTYDQVNAGTTVSLANARPGDLVFFYDDISHVGIYIGNGMMIHAPKPGAYVREESIYYGGESIIHSVVRPG
ncbi:glycoside hydrolase [Streptomyces sp. IMTB 2501]|uniref:C40 family peptidase n=1 Tax=Streptomyces sp. IMTB 2501 TaxID=1776340 RepID=UPI00096C08C8|nr:C40 family peptidase [Streptomyces sp. IMTB 2501]OLZ71001.1 glycoside hydrolase [Streptomyces sp. IMTB 2501]